MNSKQESALILACGRVTDAQNQFREGIGQIAAIFRAIERTPHESNDALWLAEIGQSLAEKYAGLVSDELADLKLGLDTLCEVTA